MPASGDDAGDDEEAVAIEAAASAFGLALTHAAARGVAVHARLVREAGTRMNLTSILDPDAMRLRHVVDSLLPLALWPEAVATGGRALDLGSGAGYPGIPLALAGAAQAVTLLDATLRKVAFLNEACEATGASAHGLWGRAEALRDRLPLQERVWCRAVGPLPVLVELAFGLLASGGVLVCWKGPEAVGEEAEAGEAACRALGGQVLGVRSYRLPEGAGERTLFAYRRGTTPLPPGVPRAPALIRRRPLG